MKKKLQNYCLFIIAVLLFAACKREGVLFEKKSVASTGINFSNTITENDSINIINYYYCYNGGGVGVADFNNDGLQDIFFAGNMVSSKLYMNKGKIHFDDVTLSAGVSTTDWIMGVSVVDINNDGWMDIYLNIAGPKEQRRHHNLLFINSGRSANGSVSFTEQAGAYGLADSSFCVQSAFLDYDKDGDLDMYLLRNNVDGIEKTFVNPANYPVTRGITADRLYENMGDSNGHPVFRNVSVQAGVTEEGYGLGLAVGDLNGDGWPDVYAANDFMPNDRLLINQKNSTFKDCAAQSMRHQTYNGMGVDIADINNDGKPDLMVMDMLPENNERRKTMIARADIESFNARQKAGYLNEYMRNTLQLNQGNAPDGNVQFSEIAQLAGVQATDWSWSVLLEDFDNDGLRDCYVTNGFAKNITDLDFINFNTDNNTFGNNIDRLQRTRNLLSKLKGVKASNYIFKNNGGLAFENFTEKWGIDEPSFSNGAAYADLDNDGDLDLITSNINEAAFVLENKENEEEVRNNYFQVVVKGDKKNASAYGAAVSIFYGGQQSYSYNSPVKGYLSSMAVPLHFGIGKHTTIDSLLVTWPDGKSQRITNVTANQQLILQYKDAANVYATAQVEEAVFTSRNDQYGIHYKHTENDYNDFNDESLLPGMYSKSGPCLAIAAINKNNDLGIFTGGSAGVPGTFFTQGKDGKFIAKSINFEDVKYEDMGSLLFDVNGDGNTDLYVVSGGNEFKKTPEAYQDRLYLGDGKGNFTTTVLPVTTSSGSCVVGADFDKDGDIDLFRAGAITPGNYPVTPQSYLFKNTNGKFTNVTADVAPDLQYAGMITAAVWTDFDNDSWIDLIVVGEWMQPTFFKNNKGKLVDVTATTELQHSSGWWKSIYPVDVDGDGDMDYVLGNMGINIDYKPLKDKPVELYYGDFDGSGKKQPILSCYMPDADGSKRRFPLAFRDDLFKVIPSLKKKFWNYELYSKAPLEEVFQPEALAKATHFTADIFANCLLENKGNGKFVLKVLPVEAQLSCINGVAAIDYDSDGNTDLVVAGNSHSTEVVYGWLDASLGLLLTGNGKGDFTPVPAQKSGLYLSGDVKGLASFFDKQGNEVLAVATNSDSLRLLTLPKPRGTKLFYASPADVFAEIGYSNGRKTKQEFYWGSGYLTQSARVVSISRAAKSFWVTNASGQRRSIQL